MSIEESKLPKDERLQLVSGIDLTGSVDSVVKAMQEKIKDIETVTHVIFTAYIEKPDFESLRTVNVDILKTGITAVDQLASKLQSVVLQTGGKVLLRIIPNKANYTQQFLGKAYGVEFFDKLEIKPPLKESQERIPQPCESLVPAAYHDPS